MNIAFTAKGTQWNSQIDPRFGRTDYIVLYNEEADQLNATDNREIGNVSHGAGPQTAKKLFDLQPDVLITGNGPGGNAESVLKRTNLSIFIGANEMTIKEAYDAWKNGKLTEV